MTAPTLRYARTTEFTFPPANFAAIARFWEEVGVPVAAKAAGFVAAAVLVSNEAEGRLLTLTIWESRALFEAYYAAPGHKNLFAPFKELGLVITERDGLDVLHFFGPAQPYVRVINSLVDPVRRDEVAAYWRDAGGPLIRRQPGCIDAEGYWSREGHFSLVIRWANEAASIAFTSGPDHSEFIRGLGDGVIEIVHRQSLEKIA